MSGNGEIVSGHPRSSVFAQLVDLDQESFAATAWSAEAWVRTLQRPDAKAWWAASDGLVAGFALTTAVAGELELLKLAVANSERRRGYGRRLLEAVIADSQALQLERIHLEVSEDNTVARCLYCDSGFVPVGLRKGYYADGSDAVLLALQLR